MRRASHAQYILKSTNVNYLLENWAKGRLYLNAIRKSILTKTYPIKDAQDLLAKFNRSAFKANECQDLVIFANSLIEKKARIFSFGIDQVSLEFLLSKEIYDSKTSLQRINDPKFSAKKEFLDVLTKTFYSLNLKYVPVLVTGTIRSAKTQVDILMKKLTNTSKNMYQYYDAEISDKTSMSLAYLQTIQAKFD
ncbi:MAG: hypothetical protein ACRCV0_00315, partial [Brevinema sp.]